MPAVEGKSVSVKIGDVQIDGWDQPKYAEALKAAGFSPSADKTKVDWFITELILVI